MWTHHSHVATSQQYTSKVLRSSSWLSDRIFASTTVDHEYAQFVGVTISSRFHLWNRNWLPFRSTPEFYHRFYLGSCCLFFSFICRVLSTCLHCALLWSLHCPSFDILLLITPSNFFVIRNSKRVSIVKRFRFNNYFGKQYNQNTTVGMYNVKCSGSEKDVRNCKYDMEPHGNCTGLVNVNCGE